jgi:serine/threonine-protein kinase
VNREQQLSMSAHESRIQTLLEQILDSHVSAEEACREHPELLPEVRERLERARVLGAHISAVFPASDTRSARRTFRRLATKLPRLPGYHIEGVVASGGMGVVYRARHLTLNRGVAIKMLLAGGYAGPNELERFKREAESIAALCHPNIVQVFDAGECDGHPYFVMEFVEGGTLAQRLDGRPLRPREAAGDVATLARAVHAAHAGGIMHRDLKPGNILIALDGTLKIADFGLARRSDQPDPSAPLTITGVHLGTPSYMSPEQAAGAATAFCPLIDIYALGAILYEMLTGRPPFRGESAAETERQVLHDEPVPPARLNPRVPRDLQTICLTCLQKDPARRYGSAADLADDLERFLGGNAIHARPVGAAERAVKWCRRRPTAAAVVAISAVALAGAVLGGVWLQRAAHARHTERAVRQESARSAVESALPLIDRLAEGRQWAEAAGVLATARARLADARSPDLGSRLELTAESFEIARELDRIRQSLPEPADVGYSFLAARDAYARVFARVGIGPDADVQRAAATVRASPLREVLLSALDTAAFTELFSAGDDERARLLSVARAAAPDPWQDRFRDAAAWRDLSRLRQLVNDAPSAVPAPPVHQLVIVGLLLSSPGANEVTIEVLREAQLRAPSDFWVNLELGNALSRAGNRTEALQFFRTAVALRPTHNVAWTTLGNLLIADGKPGEAIAPLRKAVQIQPAYPASWQNLLIALADLERWDEAQGVAREAIAAIPTSDSIADSPDWLHRARARAAAARREWTSAADSYTRAVGGRCAADAEAWFELAAVHALAGDADDYRRVCTLMLDRCEHAGLRRFLAARACTLAPVPNETLVRAARLGTAELDENADAHWSLTARGALAFREGRAADAILTFERSIQADQDSVHAVINWAWLARAHASLGDDDTARQWLAKAGDWLDQPGGKPERIHLHDWLEAQLIRREAESILAR